MGDGEFSWTQVAGKRQAGSTTSWLTQASTLRQHRCTKVVVGNLSRRSGSTEGLDIRAEPCSILQFRSPRRCAPRDDEILLQVRLHSRKSGCVACPVYFCGIQPDVESLPLLRRWLAAIRDVRFSLFALLRFN